MKLNFTSLEYFRKAAKMEHLTKAAEALHIAQPALSRTIRGLEEELGVTLFEREGRNIHLTRDGHILLKHAENFLQEYDEMQQEFADSKNLQQMTVNLAIHSATKLIPSFLAEFRKDHPEAMLEIINPKMEAAPKHTDLTLYSSIHHVENEHTVTLFRETWSWCFPFPTAMPGCPTSIWLISQTETTSPRPRDSCSGTSLKPTAEKLDFHQKSSWKATTPTPSMNLSMPALASPWSPR